MGDNGSPLSFPDLEAEVTKQKKEYWDQLNADSDPDAVSKHDAFCAELDQLMRHTIAGAATLQQLYGLTSETMTNVVIAHRQGDHIEVARLMAEFDELMQTQAASS